MKIRKSIIALAFLCILISVLTIGYVIQTYAVSSATTLVTGAVVGISLLILVATYFLILLSQTIKEKYFFLMYDELVKGVKDKAELQEKYIININTAELPGYLLERILELDGVMAGQSKNGINYRINKARLDEIDRIYTVVPNLREHGKKVADIVKKANKKSDPEMDAKVKEITDKF